MYEKRDRIADAYPDEALLCADGLDEAILGVEEGSRRVVYSRRKSIEILVAQDMDVEEAGEYFDFNVVGAYVGPSTPIYVDDTMMEDEEP